MEENTQTQTNETKEEVGESEDTGKGDKSQTVIETERIRSETQELEKAAAEKANVQARLKVAGNLEGGQKPIKAAKETNKEYRTRIEKEMADGKTEW